jgi:hypothetical protein
MITICWYKKYYKVQVKMEDMGSQSFSLLTFIGGVETNSIFLGLKIL